MARHDCNAMDSELVMWKKKIDGIIAKFAQLPTGKKARVIGYIREIHILAAELDERISLLKENGYDDGTYWDENVRVNIDQFRSDFTETSGTFMDYDYSG